MGIYLRFARSLGKSRLLKYALVTNTCFGVVLRGVGDLIQQTIEMNATQKPGNKETPALIEASHSVASTAGLKSNTYQTQKYDWTRMRNISITGVVIGPLNYWWYRYLDRLYPTKALSAICKKILWDQLVGATVFTFIFIVTICLLEHMTVMQSLKEFAEKFPYIYLVDWLVWPPGQFLNFLLVPKELRVAFVNIILVCWNIFLSYVKYN